MGTISRELKRGILELLLLRILADEPTYGYELLHRLSRRSSGRFAIKEGTLYPILYRLEDAGMIVPEWDQPPAAGVSASGRGKPRKVYRLTEAGECHLKELAVTWREFSSAVDAILESEPGPRNSYEEDE